MEQPKVTEYGHWQKRARALTAQMTLNEKIGLVHGAGLFCTAGIPRLGIPPSFAEIWGRHRYQHVDMVFSHISCQYFYFVRLVNVSD